MNKDWLEPSEALELLAQQGWKRNTAYRLFRRSSIKKKKVGLKKRLYSKSDLLREIK